MAKGWGIVQDSQGNAIEDCEVKVYEAGTSTLASIFSDSALSVAIDQVNSPVTTDATGHYQFFVATGTYKFVGTKGTFTFTEDNVDIGFSVPAARSLTGTAPIEIDGASGSAKDLSANRTISIDESDYTLLSGRAGGQTILQGVTLEGGVTINDLGADVDLRVKSDTEPNALVVDGATGRVGIGLASPTVILQVRSAAAGDTNILLENTNAAGQFVAIELNNIIRRWRFRNTSGGHFQLVDATGGLVPWSADSGSPSNSLNIRPPGIALFGSGSFGGGVGAFFIGDRDTAPTSQPSGGLVLWSESGRLKTWGNGTGSSSIPMGSGVKVTAGAPYTNDGYVEVFMGGNLVRLMTTAG